MRYGLAWEQQRRWRSCGGWPRQAAPKLAIQVAVITTAEVASKGMVRMSALSTTASRSFRLLATNILSTLSLRLNRGEPRLKLDEGQRAARGNPGPSEWSAFVATFPIGLSRLRCADPSRPRGLESFIRRASDRARGEVHDLRQGRSRLPEPSDVLYPLGRELRFAAEPHSALLRFGKSPPFCTKSFGRSRVENEIQQSKSAECVSHAVTHPAAARRLSDVHQGADLALP